MGNEESQQGAPAPGQPTFGMGPPPQQPRFGGAPPGMAPAARPGGPGIPGMRLGGPGPPAALRGGPGIVPGGPGPPAAMRGAVQGQQPVRPVQVGVQPWAEPPVVQPQRFRGPGSVQQQPVRGPVPQQAPRPLAVQQQQLQLQQQQAKQQAMAAEEEVGLDLSNLSEAEKAKILSVMARAQDLDEDYERHKRAKDEATEQRPQLLCPLCQAADLTTETNKMCGDCGKNFCQKCGTFVPGEGRRSVWVCNTCSNRRKQQSAAMASGQQQDTVTYTQAGQKVAGGIDLNQRKDETMSRMGQPFQQSQQPQQQQMQQPQQSVSLIGTSSGGGGFVSGSLIPSVTPIGRGTIPGTVPLTAVSQQQWPNSQPQQQNQWNLQQQMVQQGGQQQQISLQPNSTTGMTTTNQQQQLQQQQLNQQKQLQAKGGKVEDWSPVTDLSPILDVSPSLEAAEQELMEKCQEADTLRPIPRATSGTISGMLADFNKALGLATTPTMDEQRSLVATTVTQSISGTVGSGVAVPTTTLTGNGTEMDQNQNLVQQQFRLQQQQLMIQQQQQVIAQQQQQLQQQVHLQQQMHQQQQIQSLQQQQASLAQTGVAVGGTPMQQQPQSQRKVHGRLPQPAMDQMHAAVAIAAQTPRSKSQTPRSNTPSYQRPVSPLMATSSGLLSVQQSMVTGHSPSVSPTPRKDQQDNISFDMEGGKKIRRRLPPVPLDQEPVPLRRTKDRTRTLSMGAMPLSTSADRGSWTDGRRMPQRTTSLDDGMSLTVTTTSSDLDFLQSLTSSTDTYLQFLASKDFLGSTTTTTSVLASIPSSIGLSTTSLLGRRDLSAPHSLSSYMRGSVGGMVPSTSASYLLDHSDSKLPSYIMSLKQQLREELRSVTEQSRRRITDPDLSGLLSHWPDTTTYDPLRKLGSSTLPLPSGRLGGPSLGGPALRRSRHRRHASDTKLSTSFPTSGREYTDDPLYRYKFYHPTSSMPFKSFEFESIDDHLRTDGLYGSSTYARNSSLFPRGGSTYPRRSSLTDMMLRDTPLTSKPMDSAGIRKYNRDMARLRRHTDTGLVSLGLGLDPYGRTPGGYRHLRKPRSWHPSPYVSEDEDEREEKKAKIKAEIARRRQHIEENARLHDELYKVARGRDMTGGGYVSPAYGGDRLYTSPISLESGGSSLEEMDMDYLRRYPYTSYGAPRASRRTASSYLGYEGRHPHQPWQYEGGFVEDDPLFDPLYDYSPMAPTTDSETDLAPMPLLPDMPTRSRKLLHDLGSTPLAYTDKHYTAPRSGGAPRPYDEYADGRGDDRRVHRPSADRQHSTNHHQRKAQNSSKTSQKYDFPVKRILLTRDPKDRSVSGNGLGMKVVGGKEIPGSNGMIGAYVARIYPGGVVETLGEVREGDQVLEWNGVSLTGKTYEEVQRIIASSGDEVEIVIRSDFNMLSSRSSTQHHHHQGQPQNHRLSRSRDGGGPQQHLPQGSGGGSGRSREQHGGSNGRSSGYNRNYDSAYDSADYYQPLAEEGVNNSNHHRGDRVGPSSPTRGYRDTRGQHQQRIVSPVHEKGDNSDNKEKYRAENISGEIQLQVCHDSKVGILYVTIVRARNLVTSRDNSGLPDPYVICYLLPDRCFENQRRTRYFSRCSNPEWKQTMVYPHIPQDQLKRKHLEISVWNYDINRPPEFLGEVIIDLKDTSVIDEQSRWYKLHPHDPKKYPCQSSSTLNNEGAMKMARLNNPAQKTLYFEGQDDVRKSNNLEKRFFKQLTKKSNVNENYTRVSSQSWRLPALHTGNITAHPLLPQGCHGAVCSIL